MGVFAWERGSALAGESNLNRMEQACEPGLQQAVAVP